MSDAPEPLDAALATPRKNPHEIAIGAAHIVERGHNVPPLLVLRTEA